MIQFTVHGLPVAQGSKVRNRYGGMREDNPNVKPWRAAVSAAAADEMNGQPLLAGPLELDAHFRFPYLKSHYGTGRNADRLKDSAPYYCCVRPDADKLLRAVCDALTGIVWRDDAQVARITASKYYGGAGLVWVRVRPLRPRPLFEWAA